MHAEAREYVARTVGGQHFGAVVEVGGRWINGGVRDLFTADSYTSLDLHPGGDVDVVADVRDWTPPAPVDLVICCEVLEHAEDAAGVIAACVKMLAPGGQVVITCAGPHREPHSGLDGGAVRPDEYYANVEPDDLRAWLDGLDDIEVEYHQNRGDLYGVGVNPA